MHLPTPNSRKCRRGSQDRSETSLTFNTSLESPSRSQSNESGQQARPCSYESSWDKASMKVEHREERAPTPDRSPIGPDTVPDFPLYTINKRTDIHRCAVLTDHTAVWYLKGSGEPLSALAATVLANEGLIKIEALRMCWRREYDVAHQPRDPLSGGTMALVGSMTGIVKVVADLPVGVVRTLERKPVSRAAESQTQDCIPSSLNDAGRIPSTRISDRLPYQQRSDDPTTADVGLHSIRIQDSTQDPDSPKLQAINYFSSDVEEDAGNAHSNIEHPNQQSESHPNLSQSPTSTSPSKGLALLTFKSCGRVLETTLTAPMHFTLGMTQGFRNAPTHYGDTTVRPATDVTGWQSGIKTAGKEFGLGMYDGLSGMLTQPYHGAKKEGGLGLAKGVAKGVGGAIAKPGAAVFALPAYTLQGIYTEMQNRRSGTTKGSRTDIVIRADLVEQGEREAAALGAEERLGIVRTWLEMKGKARLGSQRSGRSSRES